MAKRGPRPKPWLRKATGTWYVTLNGKQEPLGKDKREAESEYHRLMVAAEQGGAGRPRITVRELIDAWLADCRKRLDPKTVANYERHATSFAEAHGSMRAADVKKFHVQDWLDGRVARGTWRKGKTPIARSTRHLAITIIKLAMEWGEYIGHLDRNPIRQMKRPGIDRRRPITVREAEMVMAEITPGILVAIEVMLATGVRPGELCSMVAENIDMDARKAIVLGKRTRRNRTGIRTVYLSDGAVGLLVPLVNAHPRGPIFFCQGNDPDRPLRPDTLRNAMARARARACRAMGLPDGSLDHVKPHCFRGLYATEALRRRVDAVLVAKSMGQADTGVLMEHYAAPDDEMMLDAVNRASRTGSSNRDTPPALPE